MSSLEKARPWLEKAAHDLHSAQIIYEHAPQYWDTIAFHCQQSVEKCLKAYLVFLEISFRRTHDLVYLLHLISEKTAVDEALFEMAYLLEAAGVEFRYPDHRTGLEPDEVREAIEAAAFFQRFVFEKMGLI